MSSILRPTPAQKTRRLVVLAATVFSIIAAYGQMGLGLGQTAAEFSADSDATLKVAGWAFSIWGIIYLGLLAYAVRQALPQTGESPLIHRLGWPSAAALLGIGWWIVAAAIDWEIGTILLIFGSAIVLIVPLLLNAATVRALPRWDRDRWLVAWPLSLLAGWLTIAAPVNLLTVLTGNGDLPAALSPTLWAILAVVVVSVLALVITAQLRIPAYALPIAWGLIGAFAAEQSRNPTLAFAALAAAIAVIVGTVVLVLRLRSGVEKARSSET